MGLIWSMHGVFTTQYLSTRMIPEFRNVESICKKFCDFISI